MLIESNRVSMIVRHVLDELQKATHEHGAFRSAHEGFAVLKEEVDELCDEVRGRRSLENSGRMQQEAVQVAAMALRFLLDVCYEEITQVKNSIV